VRDGVWRVDVEVARDPVTGRRRRAPRYVHGSREDAEVALARLKVADHEKRLPSSGTSARSVRAAFQLYLQAIEAGLVEWSRAAGRAPTVASARISNRTSGGCWASSSTVRSRAAKTEMP
jgi:hypothetical protein